MSFESFPTNQSLEEIQKRIALNIGTGKRRHEIADLLESEDDASLVKACEELEIDQSIGAVMRQYAQLRKRVHKENDEEVERRFNSDAPASPEEEAAGVYREQIEPQVRDAVFLLRKKGYQTVNSGFEWGIFWKQYISFAHDQKIDLGHFAFSNELLSWANENGADIRIGGNDIEITFTKVIDMELITKIWDRVAEEMPVVGSSAVAPAHWEKFRRGH
jgi:hypothetical protein